MAKVRIGISIPNELREQLSKQAAKEEKTPTSLVAFIVEKYIKRRGKKK